MLARLIWKPLGRAIFNAAVDWAKDPKNHADADKAVGWVLGKVTDIILGQWDNKLLNEIGKHIPFLGGGR